MPEGVWPDGKTSQDWYDVAGLAMEMSRADGVSIHMEITTWVTNGRPDLLIKVTGVPQESSSAAPAASVCASFVASQTRLKSLKALFTYGLYQMDFQCALKDDVKNSPA